MPQRLPPQYLFNDTSAGVIQKVKWNMVPQNSVDHAINMVFDDVLGEAVVRKGLTTKGSTLDGGGTNTVTGLFYFKDNSGTNAKLIATCNQSIMYFDGSAWQTGKTGETTGLKTRFETFLNEVVRVNGTDSPVSSSNGTTWSSGSALDVSNMPVGKFIRVYKDHVCVAGVSSKPDSLYVSSPPNSTGTAISWTTNAREIVINPEDGGNISGLGEVGTLLIVFKDNGMYRWNNNMVEADQIINIGCSSQESIVNLGGSLLSFFNDKGVWLTTGEQPVLISRRVQKWIDGMSASHYDDVASYGDGENLYVSIGDCTVDGTTYNNVVLYYSNQSKAWTVFSYPYKFRVFSRFLNGNEVQIVGGDTTARVLQLDSSSVTDNGTAIGFQLESHDLDFGSRALLKEVSNKLYAFGINPNGAIIQAKTDFNDWQTIGTIQNRIQELKIKQTIRGNFVRFRVVGISSSARFRFQGLELPFVEILDYA